MTEENETEDEFDVEAIDERVEELHSLLDQIKTNGQQIERMIVESGDVEESKRHQMLARRASLLYDRVQRGDHNLVRGK